MPFPETFADTPATTGQEISDPQPGTQSGSRESMQAGPVGWMASETRQEAGLPEEPSTFNASEMYLG